MGLDVSGLNVTLGDFKLRDVNLSCPSGEYHVLVGPNGSGKSTLIRSILGLIAIDSGEIRSGLQRLDRLPPERRGMGFIPQNYALFPFMNAKGNILFGAAKNGRSRHESDRLIKRIVSMLSIETLMNRTVDTLSGGEKQKVAFARALVSGAETVLFDEPFSAIDEARKKELWFELRQGVSEFKLTALHVTHQLEEAEVLGDCLSVMMEGAIVQAGAVADVFRLPKNESVARFLNYKNLFQPLSVSPVAPGQDFGRGTRFDIGHFEIYTERRFPADLPLTLCIRSQDIKVIKRDVDVKPGLRRNLFEGDVVRLFKYIDYHLIWLKIDGSDAQYDFEIKVPRYIVERQQIEEGGRMRAAFLESKIIVMQQ